MSERMTMQEVLKEYSSRIFDTAHTLPMADQYPDGAVAAIAALLTNSFDGAAIIHHVLPQPEIEAGRLICPFEQVLVSKNAFYLVCQEQQSDQGKIVAFRDWMLELVEQEEARRRARLADG